MINNYGVNVGRMPLGAIGREVEGAMTAKEAIEKARLDWTVSKRPVRFPHSGGGTIEMPGRFVTVRDDIQMGLGVLTDRYEILQNKTAFDFTDALTQEKLGTYEMALSLDGGRRIVIMFRLPETIKVMGSDPIKGYIMFSTTHDGSGSVMGAYTPKRMFCLNQLNGLLSAKGASFKIRHTQSMLSKIDVARNALGIAKQSTEDMLTRADAMARTKLNRSIVELFLKEMDLHKIEDESGRRRNTRDHILHLQEFGYGHGQPEIKNSLWTLYNAVTQHIDHRWPDSKKGATYGASKAVESSMFGAGAVMKEKALDAALSLAK